MIDQISHISASDIIKFHWKNVKFLDEKQKFKIKIL